MTSHSERSGSTRPAIIAPLSFVAKKSGRTNCWKNCPSREMCEARHVQAFRTGRFCGQTPPHVMGGNPGPPARFGKLLANGPGGITTAPTVYRFQEMTQVYDTTLKALIHKRFRLGGAGFRCPRVRCAPTKPTDTCPHNGRRRGPARIELPAGERGEPSPSAGEITGERHRATGCPHVPVQELLVRREIVTAAVRQIVESDGC
ncbi:hypothetical protein EAO69_24285 [Streptomyces sp. me109]|uniref:cyanase n=1 Tax=Streptomyces sp. me109 TaxID=1827853 RepID=UPI0011CE0903|nr:hypothetical protein EAO69_24285 [Streptomyces sp. me109]